MPGIGFRTDTIKIAPDNNNRYVQQFTYVIVYKITQGVTCPLS